MTKSQELKEEIIKKLLLNLSIDPYGKFVDAEKLSIAGKNYFLPSDNNTPPSNINFDSENILSKEDKKEITQVLVNYLVSEIKQNAGEWRIESEGELTIIKHQSGKKHYKEGLEKKQWQLIEQVLNQQGFHPNQIIKKSKELKEKIIKELLPNLSIGPWGSYVDDKELSKRTYNSIEDFYFDNEKPRSVSFDPSRILSKQDKQEIYCVLINYLVNDIKQNAGEWRIESEGELTIIKHQSGKKHYKEGFTHEWGEWNQIEQALNQQGEEISSSKKQQAFPNIEAKVEQPPKTSILPFRGDSDKY